MLQPVARADEIGRITLDGRTVILSDDNTWVYASEKPEVAANCTEVASEVLPVSICLDPDKWTFADLGGEAEYKLRSKTEELYLLIITEETLLSIPTLKKAAITNAQEFSGLTKVKTLLDGSAIFDGQGFGQIEYATTIDGIDITYANYLTSFEDAGSLQLVFFAGTGQFDALRGEISEAMAGIRIGN